MFEGYLRCWRLFFLFIEPDLPAPEGPIEKPALLTPPKPEVPAAKLPPLPSKGLAPALTVPSPF